MKNEWFGKLPKQWTTTKLKYISKVKTGGTPPKSEAVNYSIEGIPWLKPDDLKVKINYDTKEKISEIGLRHVEVIPSFSILVSCIGEIKTAYAECEVTTNQQINSVIPLNIDNKYLYYSIIASEDELKSKQQKTVVPILNKSNQENTYYVLPPIKEQEKIVSFLEDKTRKLDKLIEKKQKLIELLQEKRQAIIDEAVTKGLDPNAPMKDSGIEWLGAVPAHWKYTTVRNFIRNRELVIQDGNHGELHPTAKDYVDDGIPFIMASNIKSQNIDVESAKKLPEKIASDLRIGFAKPGDVLLTHKGTVGETAIIPEQIDYPYYMLTPQVTYYRFATSKLVNKYVFYYFQSSSFKEQLNYISGIQSTRDYIGLIAQKDLILLMPTFEEQFEIISSLETNVNKYDQILLKIRLQIEKLQEYRQSLISEAVTGKINVRQHGKEVMQ